MDDKPKQENLEVKWHKNDVIRNKQTAHPYLVIHIFKNMCTMIVDLESAEKLSQAYALLPKEYYHYAVDSDMKVEEEDDKVQFKYEPFEFHQQTI